MADDLEQATLPRIPRKLQKKFSTTNQKVEEVKTETREVKSALEEAKKDIIAEIKDSQKETKKEVKKERKSNASAKAKKTTKRVSAKPKAKKVAKKTVKKTVSRKAITVAKPKTASANVSINVTAPGAKATVAKKGKKVSSKPTGKKKKPAAKKKAPKFVNERSFVSLKKQTTSLEQMLKKLRNDVAKSKSNADIQKLSKSMNTIRKDTNKKIASLKTTVKEAKDAALVASGVTEEVNHVKDMIGKLELTLLEKMSNPNEQKALPAPAVVESNTSMTELEKIMNEVKRETPRMTEEMNQSMKDVARLESRLKDIEAEVSMAQHQVHDSNFHAPAFSRMVHARVPDEQLAVRLVQLYFQEIASPNLKRQVDLDGLVNAYVYALEKLHSKKMKGIAANPMASLSTTETNTQKEIMVEAKA